jgi:hypothetical protein
MGLRGITLDEALKIILKGEIIETIPKARSFPKCLIMFMMRKNKPLYVSCAFDGEIVYILTVHWMDPDKWVTPWKRKRKKQ